MANLEVLREALAIESAGGDWKMKHVQAVLNCARSTVYQTPYLTKLRKRVGKRGVRWTPREVRSYQALVSSGGRAS